MRNIPKAHYGQKEGIVRTAIFLGLIYVGDAIGKPSYIITCSNVATIMAIALLVFALMDVIDFFRNRKAG